MTVVFDATILMHLFRPEIGPPIDSTGLPIEKGRERLELLVATLEKDRIKAIIPTPALSELLVRAGAEQSQRIVEAIGKSSALRIEPFDSLSAIEVATMTREALVRGGKKDGIDTTWAKVKFDRQIVAIAKVHQATTIYSDDADVHSHARRVGMRVIAIADLPIPEEKAQPDLFDRPLDDADMAAAEIAAQASSDLPPDL